MRRARWIRLGFADFGELRSMAAALSGAQARHSSPIVLWGAGREFVDAGYGFVIVVPEHLAPGTRARWTAWALSPAVAAYRDFGVRAYLEGPHIAAQGRRIASSQTEVVDGCVVISAQMGTAAWEDLPQSVSIEHATEFCAWMREGLGLAVTQWAGTDGTPPERVFEAVIRARIEAQHDWQFENSWPNARERFALAAPRTAAEPVAAAHESDASAAST